MKKIFYIGLAIFVCLTLVGCGGNLGGKKITCEKSTTEDDGTNHEQITVTYKNDKLTYLEGKSKMVYADESTASMIYSYMPFAESVLEDAGFEVESKIDGKAITMTFKGNMEEISKNKNFEDLDYDYSFDTDAEDFIAEMKEEGYTCK